MPLDVSSHGRGYSGSYTSDVSGPIFVKALWTSKAGLGAHNHHHHNHHNHHHQQGLVHLRACGVSPQPPRPSKGGECDVLRVLVAETHGF